MMQLCHQMIHYDLENCYYKMSISEKIKAINSKVDQNKAQYNLDRQTANISALPSGNWQRYFIRTRLEYSPLGKTFEKHTNVIKKQTEFINKKEDKRNKLLKTIF